MTSAVTQLGLLCVAASALVLAAGFLAALLRLESPIAYALATNLFAWAILITATLVLSPMHEVRGATTWGWLVAVLVVAIAVWWRGGRPPAPLAGVRRRVAEVLGDPLVKVLAITVGIAIAYLTALAVVTPENEGDALAYHVARAAFWHQHHGLSYIGNAVESRLNVNPPNAEIGDLFTMLASGTQRFVGLVQVTSLIVCLIAAIGIARRIGARPTPAVWAGLLVATLPVVTTQAPTAQNDLVVAAFLATAAYFLFGNGTTEMVLAGLALALAIGTKFTAVLSVPLLLVLILVMQGRARRAKTAWLLGVGALGGSTWYLVNLAQTGHFDGGLAQSAAQTPSSIHVVLGTLIRFLFDSLDLSGLSSAGWGWDGVAGLNSFVYQGVGLGIVLVGLVRFLAKRHGFKDAWICGAGVVVAATPSLVDLTYRLFFSLGHSHVHALKPGPNITAGATPSWYGPLGVLGVLVGIVIAGRAVRDHETPRVALVLGGAPVILVCSLALTLVWDPWRGRFFILSYVLATAAWHLMLSRRWLAWAVTAIACVTTGAVLANTLAKPSGLRSIDNPTKSAVWGEPDWRVQAILRPRNDDLAILRIAEQQIPRDAALALVPRGNDFLAPYFGPGLQRHVDLVLDGGLLDRRSVWLLAAPGVRPDVCPGSWRVLHGVEPGWLIARRVVGGPACARPRRLPE